MFYSIALHLAAGLIAGCLFTVRILLVLLILLLIEVLAVCVFGTWALGGELAAGLVSLQLGYVAAAYTRNRLERPVYPASRQLDDELSRLPKMD